MFASVKKAFLNTLSAAKDMGGEVFCNVGKEASAAKSVASELKLQQLLKSCEGPSIQVKYAPDIYITFLEVNVQDELEVADFQNFTLQGITCRTRLDVKATAAQLVGMLAAKTTKKVLGKVAAVTGIEIGKQLVESSEKMRETLANKAAEDPETKSMEFDIKLDLEVKDDGQKVSAVVDIATDVGKAVSKVIPVQLATRHIEEAFEKKMQDALCSQSVASNNEFVMEKNSRDALCSQSVPSNNKFWVEELPPLEKSPTSSNSEFEMEKNSRDALCPQSVPSNNKFWVEELPPLEKSPTYCNSEFEMEKNNPDALCSQSVPSNNKFWVEELPPLEESPTYCNSEFEMEKLQF